MSQGLPRNIAYHTKPNLIKTWLSSLDMKTKVGRQVPKIIKNHTAWHHDSRTTDQHDKQSIWSLHMKTKVVQHVPRINIKHLTYDRPTWQHDIWKFPGSQLLSNDIWHFFRFTRKELESRQIKNEINPFLLFLYTKKVNKTIK